MHFLLFDTSTERGVVALADASKLLFARELPFGLSQGQILAEAIDQTLRQAGIGCADLAAIGVGIGPGSYTGMRVSAVTAQALAYANHLPVIGFSAMQGLVCQEFEDCAGLIDARSGGVYLLKANEQEPKLIPRAHLKMALRGVGHIVTPSAERLKLLFQELEIQGVEWHEQAPNLEILAKLVRERFARQDFAPNGPLRLLYLRESQAEIEQAQGVVHKASILEKNPCNRVT